MIGPKSRRWSYIDGGKVRESTFQEALDKSTNLCYGGRKLIGWYDKHEWQKITKKSLYDLSQLLSSGEFVKIAVLGLGKPEGEDDSDGDA